ncbi:Xaa-Pro peptidase family protein [Melissococcus plutonius]|uniref:Proline dipeptidase n=1 Tax=Melissococcus plutonius TaxID=33970 RepID=A0A2Z5Y2N1_9ENTE|nr:Xaa-Pro peptidase family protein [Melissococcus plutonius]BAL62235.1 proline dipeptidase [Melissococcus plutonius DAT561]MCV2498006.1 Xaa-Pro peptidase family protein [Melissococcus plutonius]MCV2501429.1 Xaa-Pro peptidase family protein [Melissococcus plutonius]MCV2505346.1 Xaa-Pro peptidase family protein [Melissococcus plutonius]MCV2506621.1 Xaa-Pro peptidase family protein [Melissococcus plutonius]
MNQTKMDDLRKWMISEQIDFTYVCEPRHVAYFSGYESDPHERVLALFLAVNEEESFLFTPALEVEEAKNSSWNAPVYGYLDSENPWEKIAQLLQKRNSAPTIAFEKDVLSVDRFDQLKNYLPSANLTKNATPVIEKLQLIKTQNEIDRLMAAGDWADKALLIGFNAIQDGASEQEIVAEIEYQLKRQGVLSMSFDTLVLTGKNAANPHGTPGNTLVAPHQLVLFDLGVIWDGYCSDVSRTVSFKEPNDFQKEIYQLVLTAQLKAIEAVKPGITASELDSIARNVITEAGYGEYFNHRLGHGIGSIVHEYPSIITGNDLVIEEGMCFSIEPGVYIPENIGVRIEDCLHVTKTGCELFTKTPKELLIFD